ncbi:ATPase [hydrothermal vent metagenome]|uniref:ATPase n=1 Tax=hydrothermal vent metagenome TaxID=652676 RepID=A0A3B0XT16_9ZZZZ
MQLSHSFPVLLLTGARQIGKTTLLETCSDRRTYVTLDNLDDRALAKNDPALFLQRYKPPLIIDEVQYAPELFSYIKMAVDKDKTRGLFWLTGSQKFHLMKNVTETLAGRVAVIDMLGFSQAEIDGRADQSRPFLPVAQWIEHARETSRSRQLMDVYSAIWRGSFPVMWVSSDQGHGQGDITGSGYGAGGGAGQIDGNGNGNGSEQRPHIASNLNRDMFYNSYVQTYIQRDVRDLTQVGDELLFSHFLKVVAARTGQLLNYSNIASDTGIDQKTAKSWLSILETSGLVYLLYPYHNNVAKRVIKTPKLYFLDTGLCAYLTHWTTPETLEAGAMSGAILETYMISEILKSYWHNARQANFYFYRDHEQKEVDLLIEQDNMIYPVEFKKTATPALSVLKNFPVLKKLDKKIAAGAVICLRETDTLLSDGVYVIPVGYL